jgi:glycosyltransferase involved in cell wall biosynthesis
MQITFIENSINFTSSSLNYKAIDANKKNLINFAEKLAKNGHSITIYNNTNKVRKENGVLWNCLDSIKREYIETDVLIVCDDIELINNNVNSKIKFFWLSYFLEEADQKKALINLIKNKYIILYNSISLIKNLKVNFNYVPKLHLDRGVNESFFNIKKSNLSKCCALITSHPLRGLDWMIDVWKNIIALKVPWAELHIFSQTLSSKNFSKNVKINNLKLKLYEYKNEGIFIKKPLIESEFINNLNNYRVHLNPAINSDFFSSSILESQAAGIPVVSRINANIHEIIYNNETGYITNDIDEFASKTINLLNDNVLFSRISNNAKLNNRIKKWEDIVMKFERAIDENIIHR